MTKSQLGVQDTLIMARPASQLLRGLTRRALAVFLAGVFANAVTTLLSITNTRLQTGYLSKDRRVALLSL